MYIPRTEFASAYAHLKAHANPSTSSILILCALDTDSVCATRILTHLLKRDFIQHNITPVAGYIDLQRANEKSIQGNADLRFVICLGLGGMVDLPRYLDLNLAGGDEAVECWVIDGRRPWNLHNVFANSREDVNPAATAGKATGGKYGIGEMGGVKCFDDGDIVEEMRVESESFKTLSEMPIIDPDSDDDDGDDGESDDGEEDGEGGVQLFSGDEEGSSQPHGRKRKSSEEAEDSDLEDGDRSRRLRRDSDASSGASTPILHRHTLLSHASSRPIGSSPPPINSPNIISSPTQQLPPAAPPPQPSTRALRRRLRKLQRKNHAILDRYYEQGTWYGEPISGLLYSLAADLGREDNDLLWLAIVGVCSGEIYGRTTTAGPPRLTAGGFGADTREAQIRGILKDEVRRLNPPELNAPNSGTSSSGEKFTSLQTTAKSPNDNSIRISPEYRFMLIRHWSLYDSMLHSSYLGTKLHIWSEYGKKRLHKLLAKMGFSLSQCKQSYTHMDMDLKRTLKEKLERYAPLYGLEGVIKEGFVRCWGWRGCLSAVDVGYVIGGILELGTPKSRLLNHKPNTSALTLSTPSTSLDETAELLEEMETDEWISNFWAAYDTLEDIEALKRGLPTAMSLHRAILRTGTALIEKRELKHLKAFRLAVLKEGPDLPVFTHPNALSKLALWLAEAVLEQEKESGKKRHLPLVVASLNERRGVYVVVGTALGAQVTASARIQRRKEKEIKRKAKEEAKRKKEEEEGLDEDEEEEEEEEESEDEDDEDDSGGGRNKFGLAFQHVANSTSAKIRIDQFEATVVEVAKDDLAGFLESLSYRSVIG